MKIKTDSWHYRWYVFNHQLVCAFCGDDYYHYEPDESKIGLCPYMRTILIWGPLVMLAYALTIAAVSSALLVVPSMIFGWQGVAFLFLAIAGLAFVCYAISFLLYLRSQKLERLERENEHNSRAASPEHESAASLFWQYLVSLKTKVCPILEIDHGSSSK